MIKENIALVDMDGTLADYDGPMKHYLKLIQSPTDPPLPEDSHDGPPWLQNRIKLIRKQPGFWRNLPVIELGMKVFNLMRDVGYTNIILTKGPASTTRAWTEKREWCHQHVSGTPVTMTEGSTGKDKGIIYGRVLFDDWPPYILSWLKHRPRGLVLMLDQPWNRDFNHPQVHRVTNVLDLPHVLELLRNHYYNA